MKDNLTVFISGNFLPKRSLRAIGSLIDIYPAPSAAPKVKIGGGFDADQESLTSDWSKVGGSLRFAFETRNSEPL